MKTTTQVMLFPCFLLLLSAPLAAQRFAGTDADSELLNYMRGDKADPACGVCIGAARKRSEDLARERRLKATAGMVAVPAGKYRLGSPAGVGDPDEKPAADIILSAFYIDKNEVTIGDYIKFARTTSDNFPEWMKPGGRFNIATGSETYYRRLEAVIKTCDNCPVFGVAWEDADAYCRWKHKRLPTEAEWEAAAGADAAGIVSPDSAWLESDSNETPHPVGRKKANKYGLNDMAGNVWEWVADFYEKTYFAHRPAKDPQGPETGKEHVIKGGSWASDADEARAGNRASTKRPNDDIGFRCAVSGSELSKNPKL